MFRPRTLRLVLAVALLAALTTGLLALRDRPGFLLGGIMVNEPDHARWVEALDEAGMNAVSVTAYAHQGDWDGPNLWFDDNDPAVVSEVRAARGRGLESLLVLRVALDHAFEHNAFLWHGMIHPTTDADLEEWFRRYRAFVLQWAEIARDEGIAVLAVGSELNSLASTRRVEELPALEEYYLNEEKQSEYRATLLRHEESLVPTDVHAREGDETQDLRQVVERRIAANRSWAEKVAFQQAADPVAAINRRRALLQDHWTRLIRDVREVYPGRLTFAANFDQYQEIAFWNELDLLGINAYFKLRKVWRDETDAHSLLPDLIDGWSEVLGQIDGFRRSIGRPAMRVLFTELGYTRRANSTFEPWASSGASVVGETGDERVVVWDEQPLDLTERALAVRALRQVESRFESQLLAGILYWKLSTLREHAEIEPFVLLLDSESRDPLLDELRAFRGSRRLERLRERALSAFEAEPEGDSGQ